LETAAKNDNSPGAQASLGSAYLLAGEREKAVAAFTKLAEVDPKGDTFNDVAYQMANADLKLPLALDYAKKAVRAAEDESQVKEFERENLDLKITMKALGNCELSVFLTPDHLYQEHSFTFDLDQSYLPPLIKQLECLLKAYPLKGIP